MASFTDAVHWRLIRRKTADFPAQRSGWTARETARQADSTVSRLDREAPLQPEDDEGVGLGWGWLHRPAAHADRSLSGLMALPTDHRASRSESEGLTAGARTTRDGVVELKPALHHGLLEVDLGAVEEEVGLSIDGQRDGGLAELKELVLLLGLFDEVHEVGQPRAAATADADAQDRVGCLALLTEHPHPLDGCLGHGHSHGLAVLFLGLVVVDGRLGVLCQHGAVDLDRRERELLGDLGVGDGECIVDALTLHHGGDE